VGASRSGAYRRAQGGPGVRVAQNTRPPTQRGHPTAAASSAVPLPTRRPVPRAPARAPDCAPDTDPPRCHTAALPLAASTHTCTAWCAPRATAGRDSPVQRTHTRQSTPTRAPGPSAPTIHRSGPARSSLPAPARPPVPTGSARDRRPTPACRSRARPAGDRANGRSVERGCFPPTAAAFSRAPATTAYRRDPRKKRRSCSLPTPGGPARPSAAPHRGRSP